MADVFRLNGSYEVDVMLDIRDESGRPAEVDGIPRWTVVPPDLLTIVAAPDGRSATLVPHDQVGVVVTVTVTVDPDLDPDETAELLASAEIALVAGEAATLGLEIRGEPRPKRDIAPPIVGA